MFAFGQKQTSAMHSEAMFLQCQKRTLPANCAHVFVVNCDRGRRRTSGGERNGMSNVNSCQLPTPPRQVQLPNCLAEHRPAWPSRYSFVGSKSEGSQHLSHVPTLNMALPSERLAPNRPARSNRDMRARQHQTSSLCQKRRGRPISRRLEFLGCFESDFARQNC